MRDEPKLAVERQRKMFVIEVAQSSDKAWIQVKLGFIYEKHRVARSRIAQPQVTLQDLFLARTELVDVVFLAVTCSNGKGELAV